MACFVGLAGCHDASSGPGGAPDAAIDAAAPDAHLDASAVGWDAEPEADALVPWDSGSPVDAVAGSVFRLPPSGQSLVTDPWLFGSSVVYAEERNVDRDVYLYDLETQTETTVVSEPGHQTYPYIWQDTVMWSDGRWYSEPDNLQMEVFEFNRPTSQIQQVTNSGSFNYLLRFNDTHILYQTLDGVPQGAGGLNLMLLDRQTGFATMIASHETWWEGADLSEAHATWVAHGPGEVGSQKSVFLHDLSVGTTELIASTLPSSQLGTSVSGDWVTWEDNRNGNWDIYAYRISTGLEYPLVTEPHDQIQAFTRDELVVWGDYRWSLTGGSYKDLVIYDLRTGFWRRVTGWTDTWVPAATRGGWLVYRRTTGYFESELYAMDLVPNLILDPDGRVIP